MKLIQPLSEEFLYCSPERIGRQLYRLKILVRNNSVEARCKTRKEASHGKAKPFRR